VPELPEVESVARSLRPRLVGRTVIAVEASGLELRKPVDIGGLRAACVGAQATSVDRRGKYVLVAFSSAHSLIVHLGMSGQLVFAASNELMRPHTHVRFRLDGALELRYVDPRRFGLVAAHPTEELSRIGELAALGVDPLSRAFTASWLRAQLLGGRCDLKAFLLDQSRVAGLGNIYVCEALFDAGLSPRKRSHRTPADRVERLHKAIRSVLVRAVKNRGTSFSDYVDADGQAGANQIALRVYGREGEPCRRCGGRIRRTVQAGRSTFYCPRCQK
jgi:formamidopyrimidine-DNA glycosylase